MPRIHAVFLIPHADPALIDPLEVVENIVDYYEGGEYDDVIVESAEWEK